MHLSQNLFSRKNNYLHAVILLLFITVTCAAFSMTGTDDYDMVRREVLLRQIGHELLLQSGDSTSRVLPIKKIAENEYQISFEHELTFRSDSLVKTTQRVLAKDPLAGDYIVNVINCGNGSVAYGYALSKNKKDDIVACIGRIQPIACYTMNIKFKSSRINAVKNEFLLGGLPFLALVGFILMRAAKPRNTLANDQHTISLGSVLFDAKNHQLVINENTIDLTKTETRILLIFALAPNEVIQRSRLQKEIWEDEGVIVGRSLDMFISKLRKKLEADSHIKILVIRGKGYKLEISCSN